VLRWAERSGTGLSARHFREAVRTAWEFRQDPGRFDWLWQSGLTDLRSTLEQDGRAAIYDGVAATLTGIWRAEALWITGASEACDPDLAAMTQVYGLKARIRGWGKVLVLADDRFSRGLWLGLARLFVRGTPRSLVYACSARLLDSFQDPRPETLQWVRAHLPAASENCRPEWTELAGECVRLWNVYLRHGNA